MRLLQQHQGGSYFKHFHLHKQKSQHCITLVASCEEEIDEASAQAIFADVEKKIIEHEYEVFINSLKKVQFSELARIFGYEQAPEVFFNPDVFKFLVQEALAELEVSDFFLVHPGHHRPLYKVDAVMLRAMRCGTWVKFRLEQQKQVSVCRAKTIEYKMDVAVLDGIRSQRSRSLSDISTQLKGIESRMHQVKYGLLSVGLKIHCAAPLAPGIEFLKKGYFLAHNAGTCFNLPPVGSTEAAAELLGVICRRAGVSYLDNPDFQIQVCSPGILSPKFTALLGIAFYLGSDRIRRYTAGDFFTTHENSTGDRLVIYGAGVLDCTFKWWAKDSQEVLIVQEFPDKLYSRTDVLTCQSMRDIENVNLIATLLAHCQWNGYWETLGREFIEEMDAMLVRHQLSGLLNASWCRAQSQIIGEHYDRKFIDALNELVNYAHDEVERLARARARGDTGAASHSILFEMQELLHRYRTEIMVRSPMKGSES